MFESVKPEIKGERGKKEKECQNKNTSLNLL